MIIEEHKAIFIHIPKNAGSTVKNLLVGDDLFNKLKRPWRHRRHKDVNNKDYRKFAIVRNPYERMVSMYAYLNGFLTGNDLLNTYQWDNKSESYKIAETMKLNVDGFKEFVKDPTGEGWGDAWRLRLLNKQCYWVDKTVTILKYENLEDELSEFFGEKIDLQIINKTIHDDFSVYYDEESLDIVYNRYKEDFKRFNYDNRKI